MDMFQIVGIRIADDPALFKIGIALLYLMEAGHILDFRAGESAVRRDKAQI